MKLCYHGGITGTILLCAEGVSVKAVFCMTFPTSESGLCICCAIVEPNFNQVQHHRSTTSELGLRAGVFNLKYTFPWEDIAVIVFH